MHIYCLFVKITACKDAAMCLSVRNLFQKLVAAGTLAVSSGQMFTEVIGAAASQRKAVGWPAVLRFSLGSVPTFIFRKQKLCLTETYSREVFPSSV